MLADLLTAIRQANGIAATPVVRSALPNIMAAAEAKDCDYVTLDLAGDVPNVVVFGTDVCWPESTIIGNGLAADEVQQAVEAGGLEVLTHLSERWAFLLRKVG